MIDRGAITARLAGLVTATVDGGATRHHGVAMVLEGGARAGVLLTDAEFVRTVLVELLIELSDGDDRAARVHFDEILAFRAKWDAEAEAKAVDLGAQLCGVRAPTVAPPAPGAGHG